MIHQLTLNRRVQAACDLYSDDLPEFVIVPTGCRGVIRRRYPDRIVEVRFVNGVTTYCSKEELNPHPFRKHPPPSVRTPNNTQVLKPFLR